MRFDLHAQDGSHMGDIELVFPPRLGEYILMPDGNSVVVESIVWLSDHIQRDSDAGICPGRGPIARLFVEGV